jgi:hypothetical protein
MSMGISDMLAPLRENPIAVVASLATFVTGLPEWQYRLPRKGLLAHFGIPRKWLAFLRKA